MADDDFDMDAGVDSLAESLGLGQSETIQETDFEEEIVEEVGEEIEAAPEEGEVVDVAEPEVAEVADPPPKSWAKETHEVWSKLPPEAKQQIVHREKQMLDGLDQYKADATYGKTIKDVITPYKRVIDEAGLTEPQAMQYLMNAHVKLTYGSREQRLAAYQELGRSIGIADAAPADPNAPKPNQEVLEVKEKLSRIEQEHNARKAVEIKAAQDKSRSEVDAFASDPAHPYFDEVAEDVAIYIKSGMNLQDSYERAVWANPVTRLKEQTRLQTENEIARKKKAAEEASKAKKTKSNNINNRHTKAVPTEPKGKMFDDMPDILEGIRQRH